MTFKNYNLPLHQQGAALIVSLVLLVILTVLTASSMNSTTVSLRMADNVKQKERANHAAESALMQALASQVPLTLDGSVGIVPDPIEGLIPMARQAAVYTFGDSDDAPKVNIITLLRDRASAYQDCQLDGERLGGTGCVDQHFELRAIATAGRSGAAEQRMGFYLRVPN